MTEEPNPYATPNCDNHLPNGIRPLHRRPSYISEALFVLVSAILLLSASVQPADATDAGIYISVVWLSCWLSSLVYQRMKISRDIQSMRGFAMLIGLSVTFVTANLLQSKPTAFVVGVTISGIVTLVRYLRHPAR